MTLKSDIGKVFKPTLGNLGPINPQVKRHQVPHVLKMLQARVSDSVGVRMKKQVLQFREPCEVSKTLIGKACAINLESS